MSVSIRMPNNATQHTAQGPTTGRKFWACRRRLSSLKGGLSNLHIRLRNPALMIRLVGAVILAVTVLIATFALLYMRSQTEAAHRREIDNLGTVVAEQTFRYVREIDLALIEVRDRSASLNVRSAGDFRRLFGGEDEHQLLRNRLQNLAQVNVLAILDSSGHLLNSSREIPTDTRDVADRDYFRHFATNDDPNIYISAPTISRLDGEPRAFVARRINSRDGNFVGVVIGAIDLQYLNSFYHAINKQPGRSLTLLRRDGLVLVRNPDPTSELGKRMPADSPWYGEVDHGGGSYLSPGFL